MIEGDPLVARAETKLLKRAEKLVVLADSSKFVSRGSLVVCPLSRIHILITDRAAPASALAMLREAGVQTIQVDLEPAARCTPGFRLKESGAAGQRTCRTNGMERVNGRKACSIGVLFCN